MTDLHTTYGRNDLVEGGSAYVTYRWSRTIVQPLLVILSVSLFTGVVSVSQVVKSTVPWMSLIWLVIFVSLEAVSTTTWLDHPDRRHIDRSAYHLAELLVIAIIVRIFTWAASNEWPHFHLLPNYLNAPLELIDDPFFLVGLLLVVLAWLHAITMARIFSRLAIDQAEAVYYSTPVSQREPGSSPLPIDRGKLVERYFHHWMWGLIILVLCIALAAYDLSDVAASFRLRTIGRMELPSRALAVLIIYLFSGLLLLSQARLTAMNARWLIGGSTKRTGVERSWYRSSMSLIVAVAALAAFLPMGSTPAAGPLAKAILRAIMTLFSLVAGLLLGLVSLLLPKSLGSVESAIERASPAAPPAIPPPGEPSEMVAIILSSLFWAVAIFVTVTALLFFVRDRAHSIDLSAVRKLWHSFLAWIIGLSEDAFGQLSAVRLAIRDLRRERDRLSGKTGRSRLHFIRFKTLTPRQQLRYIYLSTVRKAENRGVERRPSETPLEYARELKEQWPGTVSEVDSLTTAFLKARYSQDTIMEEDVGAIKKQWRRMRTHLRKSRFLTQERDDS